MAETTTTATKTNTSTTVTVETEIPESFKPSLNKLQERAENLSRANERGIINEKSGASIVARDNGQINLASNEYSQYKLNPDGRAIEESLESVTIANRKKFVTDEIVVNEHKLNPHLYELTTFKQVLDDAKSAVGNFCMLGTVLVKSWEPNLKRYVLIRRQVRMPMFSPMLNVAEIVSALGIGDPLKETTDLQVSMASGYQVNGAINDAGAAATAPKTSDNTKKIDEVKNKAATPAGTTNTATPNITPTKVEDPEKGEAKLDATLVAEAKATQEAATAAKAYYDKAQDRLDEAEANLETAQEKLLKCQTSEERTIAQRSIITYTTVRDSVSAEKDAYYDKYRRAETAAKTAADRLAADKAAKQVK